LANHERHAIQRKCHSNTMRCEIGFLQRPEFEVSPQTMWALERRQDSQLRGRKVAVGDVLKWHWARDELDINSDSWAAGQGAHGEAFSVRQIKIKRRRDRPIYTRSTMLTDREVPSGRRNAGGACRKCASNESMGSVKRRMVRFAHESISAAKFFPVKQAATVSKG
jgi:hypothetical protein